MAAALVVPTQQPVSDERILSAAVLAGKQLDAQKERIERSGAVYATGNAENQRTKAPIYLPPSVLDKKLSVVRHHHAALDPRCRIEAAVGVHLSDLNLGGLGWIL